MTRKEATFRIHRAAKLAAGVEALVERTTENLWAEDLTRSSVSSLAAAIRTLASVVEANLTGGAATPKE